MKKVTQKQSLVVYYSLMFQPQRNTCINQKF